MNKQKQRIIGTVESHSSVSPVSEKIIMVSQITEAERAEILRRLKKLRVAPAAFAVPPAEKQRLGRNWSRSRKRVFKDFKMRFVWDKDKETTVVNANGRFLMTRVDFDLLTVGDEPRSTGKPNGV